ncbi:hypothetical protein BC941DRAFT_476961 [Chlamydoabsidia padenii]|nr:hypothetical protein BC941DRAFT_476961 [Chlamydoabsidia padenii]
MSRMSSLWTISDDTYCINSRKIAFFIWLSIISIYWVDATEPNNILAFLGLPRKNHCAINYDNALFILHGTEPSSLSITFSINSFDSSSNQTPSVQWIQDKANQTSSSSSICSVTSYGQAILFHPTLQHNDTIDLNSLNWTLASRRKHSSPPPLDVATVAATIMNDDKILVLGKNNTSLSTWLLDASDDQLEWSWSLLSMRRMHEQPRLDDLVSASMVTTTSYILYFGVKQQQSKMYYNVSVYCFDISSLTWAGSLLNFTSPTNHIQPVMINKKQRTNSDTNDTLLIVPDWIDTAINATTTFDRNVTNSDAAHQQQIQQYPRQDGYWILTIDHTRASFLPSTHLAWHTSNTFTSVSGSSATLIDDTVVFYGGDGDNRGMESTTNTHSAIDYADNSKPDAIRFWNIENQTFSPTPAWLAPYLTSLSSPSATPSTQINNENGYHTVIIILASFLALFGIGFIILFVILLWKKKNKRQETTSDNDTADEQSSPHILPAEHQPESATTWAEQLQRSFSIILGRLLLIPQRNPASTDLNISAPLEASGGEMIDDGNERDIIGKEEEEGNQNNDRHPPRATLFPTSSSPSIVSYNNGHPSARNSWKEEGSVKASRFVEHF